MTTLATVLNGAAAITASTAPTLGNINRYNASSGALTPTLPALSGLNVGASCVVEKDRSDTTYNTVTFTANSGDTFEDTTTIRVLSLPDEKLTLQVISVSGTKYWTVSGGLVPKSGLVASTAQFSLASSTTATDIITTTLPTATLAAGSTYRIKLFGTVQVQATSGTLTFTPFIQGTALNTIVLATQTSAEGPVGFWLEILVTVRTTGTTGTAIAHGAGVIRFATNAQINQLLTSTNTATTTVNTTSAAGSNVLKVQATWATSSATNILKVEVATIEREL
jgi:hypothetical protein